MTGCMRGPKKEGSLRRPKLAVVPHLYSFHNFKVSPPPSRRWGSGRVMDVMTKLL